MPVYDFECGECGARFEAALLIQERDMMNQSECPMCKQPGAVSRIICGTPSLVARVEGSMRPSAAFTNRLRAIKEARGRPADIGSQCENLSEV